MAGAFASEGAAGVVSAAPSATETEVARLVLASARVHDAYLACYRQVLGGPALLQAWERAYDAAHEAYAAASDAALRSLARDVLTAPPPVSPVRVDALERALDHLAARTGRTRAALRRDLTQPRHP